MDLFDMINVAWTWFKKGFRPAMMVAATATAGIAAGYVVDKATRKVVRAIADNLEKDES